jgi:hypothetical protein
MSRRCSCKAVNTAEFGGGVVLGTMAGDSLLLRFDTKIRTQVVASPSQMRRQGQIDSRQNLTTNVAADVRRL